VTDNRRFAKRTVRQVVQSAGKLPVVSRVIRYSAVRTILEKMPTSHLLYGRPWDRIHPFDRDHGTDTSGFLASEDLPAVAARSSATSYGGSQPSILRAALRTIPDVDRSSFLDLGSGKGRALFVAAEFPFREIVGVELSPDLAQIARSNAAIVARRYPERTAVQVVEGDASAFPLPQGNLVIFMYHPFRTELVVQVVRAIEDAIAAGGRRVYVVYCNPVEGPCFDSSPHLRRHFAQSIPYHPSELGYGPDESDAIVIWQGGDAPPSEWPRNLPIVLENDMRAILIPPSPPAP
jgi:SAM-dependent methyltransferase